jgi:tRNA A-37 threonylcarbamoyl transferase component Bud32
VADSTAKFIFVLFYELPIMYLFIESDCITLYFVNWQREISFTEIDGKKVVIKRNKMSKNLHDYVLVMTYAILSILLAHPSTPPEFGNKTTSNEGFEMREKLRSMGIPTPSLVSISDNLLIEEFVPGGNLHAALSYGSNFSLAYAAGIITGRLHKSGYSFTDNKSQNFLVSSASKVLRTDLAFIKKNDSVFAKSMDIGSFLGSLLCLENERYKVMENAFYEGYFSEAKSPIPYLSIPLRNILGFGLSMGSNWVVNVLLESAKLVSNRWKFGFSVKSP